MTRPEWLDQHAVSNDLLAFHSSAYPADAPLITFCGPDGVPVVTIRRNGAVEYGPDVDAAARVFWETVSRAMPGPLRGCPDPDVHREAP